MARSRKAQEERRRLVIVAAALATLLAMAAAASWYLQWSEGEGPLVVVYKDPNCACCQAWMRHLTHNGFRVRVGDASEWASVRTRFKVPPQQQGCHTAVVNGFLIEGHVPAQDLQWLLKKPHIDGVTGLLVPGMPLGSPGMESPQPERYIVYGLTPSGAVKPLITHDTPGD